MQNDTRARVPVRSRTLLWVVVTAVITAALVLSAVQLLPRAGQTTPAKTSAPPASHLPEPDHGEQDQSVPSPVKLASFVAPRDEDIPDNPFGAMIRKGRDIFVDTQANAKAFVGNGLQCVNCHFDGGRKAGSAPLWAAYVKYPAYRDKNKKVNSFEDRLAGCFTFSMNGHSPAYDSPEMVALVTYSYWLAQGAPTGAELPGRGYPKVSAPAQAPSAQRGAQVYAENCALCHGVDGQGTKVAGRYAFPPLWGKDSYNGGAGMSRVETAASFIKTNMPLGRGNTLTDQQAWDLAQFVDSHDRPPDPRKR